MFEDLNDAGSQLRRAPEQLGPGQFDRAHELPQDERQVADRPRDAGKLRKDPEKVVQWPVVARQKVLLARTPLLERGEVRRGHVFVERKAPALPARPE